MGPHTTSTARGDDVATKLNSEAMADSSIPQSESRFSFPFRYRSLTTINKASNKVQNLYPIQLCYESSKRRINTYSADVKH